jgi:outer membrane immunogenic protein
VIAATATLAGSPVLAADMALKAPPLPPDIPIWTGFYVGGNVGGAWKDNALTYNNPTAGSTPAVCGTVPGTVTPAPGANPFGLAGCANGDSVIGGGQIGYNWQAGRVVYGLEADGMGQFVNNTSYQIYTTSVPSVLLPMGTVAGDTAYFRDQIGALGTFRGRLGFAPQVTPFGNWLIYATGGLAVGGVQHSFTEVLSPGNSCTVLGGTTCRTISDSTTRVGYAVGVGAEVMAYRAWSVGVEYLFVDLGRDTLSLAPVPGIAGATTFFTGTSTASFWDHENIVRVKLSYHFNALSFLPSR